MRQFFQSLFGDEKTVFDAHRADARYHIFGFKRENHVRFQ